MRAKQGGIEITTSITPTDGSTLPIQSNGVFDALATKQDTLVSGTNIKTINSTSILGSGDLVVGGSNDFPTPAAASCSGEFVYFGTGTTVAGNLYQYNTSGAWVQFDANSTTTSIGLLAIAQGVTPSAGMMTRGFARYTAQSSYSTPTVGAMLFGSETVGAFTGTAPVTSGAIIRIIGFCIDATNDIIYFNPDNTWVELI